jgi:hypothetical protein
MSSAASKARWQGATQNAVPALAEIASASGLKLNTAGMSGGSASSGSGGSGSGGSGSGGSGSGGSGSGSVSPLDNRVGQAIAGVLKNP